MRDFWRIFDRPEVTYGHLRRQPGRTRTCIRAARWKYIDIQYHFTRELAQIGRIIVKYIRTKAMVAGALIEALSRPQYVALMEMTGVHELETDADDEGEYQEYVRSSLPASS